MKLSDLKTPDVRVSTWVVRQPDGRLRQIQLREDLDPPADDFRFGIMRSGIPVLAANDEDEAARKIAQLIGGE